jgi:hypothetical protein
MENEEKNVLSSNPSVEHDSLQQEFDRQPTQNSDPLSQATSVSNSSTSYGRFSHLPDVQDGIEPLNSYLTILG